MKDTLVFDIRNIKDWDFNVYEVLIPPSKLELDFEDIEFMSQVRGSVHLLRHSDNDVYVKADVTTEIEMQCGKCLEMFICDIAALFEVQFTSNRSHDQEDSANIEEGERYFDGETFDISEDTRRALVIQIPVWPLCSQGCEGLCQHCGENLNDKYCTCEDIVDLEEDVSDISSPFAGLSQLLESAKLEKPEKSKNNKERILKNGSSKT
ncbi:MAG: DUF177 domain-containing protein [Candidatus Poribacteria bacterium]|nr:DUF177 domain-containing protein [Candidatus Poribacteria bacterium]